MSDAGVYAREGNVGRSYAATLRKTVVKYYWLYLMLIPGVLYFLIFRYLPMWGILISFQDYRPNLGILHSDWVGFKHYHRFFFEAEFGRLFRNTMILAIYNLVFFFPLPIVLALMLNEVRKEGFKRTVQTIVYIPHFVSWVVVVGIAYLFFSTEGGIVNELIAAMGFEKIQFLLSETWFRPLVIGEVIWKETGWGTILFLAALAGVDPQLYEAAKMDGANRRHQLWHITLPAIKSTIVVLFILRLGTFLDSGFEQIFLMLNPLNNQVGDVFDTYVYEIGILQGQFSYSAAVGLFKSVVALILVIGADRLAKRLGEEGIM
ncbi:ABC transporter permease [Cohnella cellulosilytica]|uniref:ABC transporter permease n=1 Tax=Cohnella cellulosilytica TaxID=986710 RepID=A0ABW2F4Z6_9BACL